jgi:hypothetical protein
MKVFICLDSIADRSLYFRQLLINNNFQQEVKMGESPATFKEHIVSMGIGAIPPLLFAALLVSHGYYHPHASNSIQNTQPAITEPGCDKTSSIKDTEAGPIRVDVAAYFAAQAVHKARFG